MAKIAQYSEAEHDRQLGKVTRIKLLFLNPEIQTPYEASKVVHVKMPLESLIFSLCTMCRFW